MANEYRHLREFGGCRLDIENRFLWCQSEPVDLPPKALDLLCLLVEKQGEVVSKDEIWQSVWPDAFVEETNLTHNIYLLRKAFKQLGERDPIQTVPRRGYRFAGRPEQNGKIVIERHAVTQTLIEDLSPVETEVSPEKAKRLSKGLLTVAGFGCFLLMAAIVGITVRRIQQPALGTAPIRSIAILPFNSIDAGKEGEIAGLGIADLLVTRLSNIKEINVRPTSAVMKLAGTDSLVAGEHLNVDAVLEGTLFRTNDKVRVTARLVQISGGKLIWAGQFEKPLKEELRLQDEIAAQLIEALALNLSGADRKALTRRFTESPEAYDLYVKGRFHWNKRNTEGMLEAQRLFRNAIEQDPNFALAYTGLADTLATSELTPVVSQQSVNRALELEPDLAEAHATLGFIKMFHEWKWDEAETCFKTSIRLNPNYATAHHWYATLLAIRGRNDEAKSEMRRALEIDPLSHNFLADLGQLHYFAEEYNEAEEYCRRALAIDPSFVFAHDYLYDIYLQTGEHEKAVGENVRYSYYENPLLDKQNMDAAIMAERSRVRTLGKNKYLLSTLMPRPMHPNHSYHNAGVYALTGEAGKALTELEKAFDGRAFISAFVRADPVFRSLRAEPRYQEILRKMNLAD